ncbi:MAG TPA: hypothetical protein VGG10_16425 [Rhizomicrobium sp.]|jgi:hypothetical protein
MTQIIPRPPVSSAEQHLTRQVELFSDLVVANLTRAKELVGSRKDKHGLDRKYAIKDAMDVAKLCAEVATALGKLRGSSSLDINVRRIEAEPQLPPPIEG